MTLEEALKEKRTTYPSEATPGRHLAYEHGVWRSTLMRRAEGETALREDKAIAQQKLLP